MYSFFSKLFFVFALVSFIACKGPKEAARENRVGIITYDQYSLKSVPATDTSFFVVTSQQEFDRHFSLTGTTAKPSPNFFGQTVVAIGFPANGVAQIEKALINGTIMRIYASTCSSGTEGCPKNSLTLATTPKSTNVKFVEFLIDDVIVEKAKVKY